MTTLAHRQKTLPLLLVAALLAMPSLAAAAPRKAQPPKPAAEAPLAPSALLYRAWSALQSLWSEEGCRLDPNGRCLTNAVQVPTTPHTEEGCMLDPSGRCLTGAAAWLPPSTPHTDTGCMLDPNGRCRG